MRSKNSTTVNRDRQLISPSTLALADVSASEDTTITLLGCQPPMAPLKWQLRSDRIWIHLPDLSKVQHLEHAWAVRMENLADVEVVVL